MSRIENCGKCKHLKSKVALLLAFYYCGHPSGKKLVVPQNSTNDPSTGAKSATFHRVPEWCPLPDDEAHKRPAAEGVG